MNWPSLMFFSLTALDKPAEPEPEPEAELKPEPRPINPAASPSTISISSTCTCASTAPAPFRALSFSLCSSTLSTSANAATNSMNNAQMAMPRTYHGPSARGYSLVPTSGPHWPMIFRIAMPVPLASFASWLSIVHVTIMVMEEKNPAVAG
ncbi:hypothetical protein ACKS0A_04283 [Histoplasma ohiense]